MVRQRRCAVLLCGLVILSLVVVRGVTVAADVTEKVLRDDWMALYLKGQRIGYAHTQTLEKQADRRVLYVTRVTEQLTVGRAGRSITVTIDSEVVEDKAGRLVSFVNTTAQGPLLQRVTGQVKEDELIVTTGEGVNTQEITVPAPVGLCPWALEKVAAAKGYEPGTQYALPVFVPQYPTQQVIAKVKIGVLEPKEVFDVTKQLHRAEVELSVLPGMPQVMWVDGEGVAWFSEVSVLGFKIELRKASKEFCLQPPAKTEVLMTTAIRPTRPIPEPRTLERLEVLVLRFVRGPYPLRLPTDAYQTVVRDQGRLRVTIRRAHGSPRKSYRLPYAGKEWAGLLKATSWLEINDPLIVQMSTEAVAGETDALTVARKLERYVRDLIQKKDLSMGLATALETARAKAGDCTEHAVLLAALARAAGMPSRVVTGLAYGQLMPGEEYGKFFYHMWTEVYVGEWLPLDAALGSHDATHIAITRSALDLPSDMLNMSGDTLAFLGVTGIGVVKIGE